MASHTPTCDGAAAAARAGGQRGFTFLGLLALLVILGVMLGAIGEIWHTAQQRDRERELRFIGGEFRRAIGAYYNSVPPNAVAANPQAFNQLRQYPLKLEDLLRDARWQENRRYLRKIYVDPMTGKAEWGVVKAPGDRIAGVYSLSKEKPIKTTGFTPEEQNFDKAEHYGKWLFVYQPGGGRGQPGAPAAQAGAQQQGGAGKPGGVPGGGTAPGGPTDLGPGGRNGGPADPVPNPQPGDAVK